MRKFGWIAVWLGLALFAAQWRAQAATSISSSLSVDWTSSCVNHDGSSSTTLVYTNAANKTVFTRHVVLNAAQTTITDLYGNVIASGLTSASPIVTATNSYLSQLGTLVASAATGGKLSP